MEDFKLDPTGKEATGTSINENKYLFEKAQTGFAIRFFGTLNYSAIIGIVIATFFYFASSVIVFIHWGLPEYFRWLNPSEVTFFINFFLTITGFLTGSYFNYLVDAFKK